MAPVPKKQFVRLSLNLDHIFDNTLMSITGEPVTPTKIAIFYLIRTLFHAHFGRRAVPSLRPFGKHEKIRVFNILYGLIFLKSEVSYDEFRRIVRYLNDQLGRCIYYHFVAGMQKIGNGDEAIDMLFEDQFYTANRCFNVHIRRRPEGPGMDMLKFLDKHSYMYTWIKRVMLQYTRLPQSALFKIWEQTKQWIQMGNAELVSPSHFGLDPMLPFEIDCSVRARDWINTQLAFVQLSPSQAMPYSTILSWSALIVKYHPDAAVVHLLMAVVHVQLKNPSFAVRSLKTFFDLSMLKIKERTDRMIKNNLLMEPCQVALKFGPVLQGRVSRIFGDYEFANTLFEESIQQAQLKNESMCNRIANLELTINALLTNGPILEKPFSKVPETPQQQDRRANQITIHIGADMDRPNPRAIFKNENFHENYEMHAHLLALSKFLLCLDDMMEGKYTTENRTAGYVGVGLHRPRFIADHSHKRRLIEDFASAVLSSGLIQNGMYSQATSVTKRMIVNNVKAPCTLRMETESYAVAGANLVYSLCATGNYPRAFSTLKLLKSHFPANINWMAARHIRICSHIAHFERDFLLNRFSACSKHLMSLKATAPLEWSLRQGLLLAATGRTAEAVMLLKGLECGDVRGKIRILLQIATILTEHKDFEMAEDHIEEAGSLALNVSFRDATLLVTRRLANLMLSRGLPQEAFLILVELRERIENFGSFIEKAIYYATVARCLRFLRKDPRPFLKKCKLQVLKNRWPAMQKLILAELAVLHAPNGIFPDAEKASKVKEQLGNIECDFPGRCTWMLI